MTVSIELEALRERIRAFVAARDWDTYHDPKNLTMLLASEVGELLAEFRWLTPAEAVDVRTNPERMGRIAEEIGDVGIALLELCDRIGIRLEEAILKKLELNATRYPVHASKGRAERPTRA